MSAFIYERLVTFADCTPAGAAMYFARYFQLQGECREYAVQTHMDGLTALLDDTVTYATVSASCQYRTHLRLGDRLRMRMTATDAHLNLFTLKFLYYRTTDGEEELVAEGEQVIACVKQDGDTMVPTAFPADAVRLIHTVGGSTSRLYTEDIS